MFVLYAIILALYRLYFSPLSKFPGPKFTAASGWFEFYHDVVKRGQFVYAVAEMHNQYGPIVRINPWEISVRDPSFYNTLYVAGSVRRTEIFKQLRDGIGIDGSHAVAEDHDFHRMRRKPLDPFFSRQQVQRYEEMIVDEIKVIEDRLKEHRGSGTVVTMDYVFTAMTGDLIGKICLVDPPSFAGEPDFSPDCFFALIALYTNFTFLLTESCIKKAKAKGVNKEASDSHSVSLIEHLLASNIPASEKTTDRLVGEFISILSAGTMTTARTLVTITYYACAYPEVGEKLREAVTEIMANYPDSVPRWSDLEKIPYLAACVKEGLRLSPGTLRRVVRCSPDVALQYKEWEIPKNVPTSMSAYMSHNDPAVYPEPAKFNPERWMGEYDPQMDRNFIPFSKGSRSCLGMNLAYAELYLGLAIMFRPDAPRLTLHDTDESDVYPKLDLFIVAPKVDSRGVRVTVG
ncbi:putative cytochrome P450 [Lasiosphaeria hispida]|uniref:Cytochrome P450 n=1 Tax=Lasiosphaeria hispida TaxID=260671 RepID=A0AAJ0M7I8_9PEZI|nr:putative cytochrome P450 [Lasiosphaeria hispida]